MYFVLYALHEHMTKGLFRGQILNLTKLGLIENSSPHQLLPPPLPPKPLYPLSPLLPLF